MDTHHEAPAGMPPAVRALRSTTQDRHRDMTNLVRGLSREALAWVPADGASSLAGLTLHILDVERYLTALVTGEDIGWTGELGTRIQETAADHELVAAIAARDEGLGDALERLDADRWSSLAGDLLEDLDHVAVHLGQMQLTRNLYEAVHPEAAGEYEHWRLPGYRIWSPAMTDGALSGLLVADFSRVLAGPVATMVLGDLGADIVKVERPGVGDDTRAWGPPWAPDGESSYSLAVNRNKRSVTLDLADPHDRALARTLALRADVVIENFRPGVMARHGLDHDTLAASDPSMVSCRIAGLGRGDVPGYDFLAQAVGGLMSITGDPGGEPRKVGVALVDVMAGLHAAIGILAALRHRDRTGQGQLVEIDLLSTTLFSLANQASNWLTAGVVPGRMGNRHPSIAPYETLHAADGPFVVAVGNDAQFATFAAALGVPALAGDERFVTNAARVTNREDLVRALETALRDEPAAHWISILDGVGIPCGMVNQVDDAFALARSVGLEPVADLRRDDGTVVATTANPLALSVTPISYRVPPPRLGEHDAEIRAWLGREDVDG